jgi:hypothetical protein
LTFLVVFELFELFECVCVVRAEFSKLI